MVKGDVEDDKFLVAHRFAPFRHMRLKQSVNKSLSECSVVYLLEIPFVQKVFVLRIQHLEYSVELMRFLG